MEDTAPVVEQSQYLTFHIADEEYAVGILRVKEIIQFETVTKVPTTPPWIRGVINLRGSVVPVVDLAVKFGLPESTVTPLTCIVILEVTLDGEKAVMGAMADSVSQVIELAAADIEAAPAFGTRVRVDYLHGMGKVAKKFVLILDIDRVLSTDEILVAAAVAAGAGEGSKAVEAAPRRRRSAKAAAPSSAVAPPAAVPEPSA